MNQRAPDKLDALLRQWSEDHSASEEELSALKEQITVRLATRPNLVPLASERRRLAADWKIGLGIAMALLIGLALGYWISFTRDQGLPSNVPQAQMKPSLPSRLESDSERLCAEMLRLFPTGLLWVAETPRGMELGLAKEEGSSAADGKFISIEVLVQTRPTKAGEWRTAWKAHLIAQAETLVVLASPGAPAGLSSFTFWMMPLSDGTVAVDMLVGASRSSEFTGTIAAVLPEAIWKEVAVGNVQGEELRILQIAQLLHGLKPNAQNAPQKDST